MRRGYSISTALPGDVISMLPVQLHVHFESSVSAAIELIVTTDAPGDHGAVVIGMHGCGVSTPIAAEVAAATWGFACVRHMPKEAMFTIGLKS